MKKLKELFDRGLLWAAAKFFTLGLILTRSLFKLRMSHDNGTTAIGTVKIVENPRFPAHDFLQAGRSFKCRLRHASVSYPDDAVIQVRAASLKFADSRYDSPFDLELNTGTISLFWTARNFLEFAQAKKMTQGLAFSAYYDKYPTGLEAGKEGIRKYPSSFSRLYYYSQCAQLFLGKDGVKRYVKFRMIPEDRGEESGIIPRKDLENRWSELAAPGETLSPNYLKQEFADRIGLGPVRYHLQLQLHTAEENESPEIFNCNVAWDEKSHPWMDAAQVEVNRLLSLDENNLMRFSVGLAPASLGIIPSVSIDDYNSINYLRTHAGAAKTARLFFYKIFGMPKPVTNWRDDTSSERRPARIVQK